MVEPEATQVSESGAEIDLEETAQNPVWYSIKGLDPI